MVAFDASSMIHAWDNYPLENFPPFWEWFAIEIASKHIVMSKIAFEEVEKKMPDCGRWLKDNGIERIKVSNEILSTAAKIKHLLGITDDNYHPKGVGEKDILIVATSKVNNLQLISNERRQFNLPDIPSKYKIPFVCSLPEVAVSCVDFINFIKDTGAVFK